MARTQYTFTFTNAQPGSVVSFDNIDTDHLFAAATGSAKLGHPLVLNAQNAISVWSDAAQLTATTEDGVGNNISATATVANPNVTTADGTAGQNPFGSGTSGAVTVVRAFPFAFDTPGLVAGHTVYTPAVDDVLLDGWLEVTEAWDGTTPMCDFGTFVPGPLGLYGYYQGPADLTLTDHGLGENAGLNGRVDSSGSTYSDGSIPLSNFLANVVRVVPARVSAANPIKVCVSTTGRTDGADPGATQGAAVLYLVTATPV